jgi:DNA mismatch repair protein MutS
MAKIVTPIRQQYLEIKKNYPDAILFFRLGDFYETFDADAEIAARELDIVLTSRNVAKGDRVPMAGIPHHAAENYIGRLIERGYHVAICEQIGDGPVQGLFPREVVRVITPGTILESELLPGDANNYLLSVYLDDARLGLSYADVSTGEFAAGQFVEGNPREILAHELARLRPAEVILDEDLDLGELWSGSVSRLPAWKFALDGAEEVLKSHFGTATLAGFGLQDMPLALRAAGAMISYLKQTQAPALDLLTGLATYGLQDFMVLDAATRRNLELTETIRSGEVRGSLLGVLDRTVTPLGRRMLRQWLGKPLLDRTRIEARLDQVQAGFENGLWRTEIRTALKPIGDLERVVNRIVAGLARPLDLVALRSMLEAIPGILEIAKTIDSPGIDQLVTDIDRCEDVFDLLQRAIADEPPATLASSGVIRSGFSDELDRVHRSSREARDWIANLEGHERERTGIKNLKVGYNKVFGYYIEVTKSNAGRVPEGYIRKQTLVNAERYITPEMKEYESLVLTAEEQIREIESRIYRSVCSDIAQHADRLLQSARSLGRMDVVTTLAEVAALQGYVRPTLMDDDTLDIQEGRHPVVERLLTSTRFVPNDVIFEPGERVRVITGPNMSGKSTYLRQVALLVLMAQMGSYVPARAARLGITDRIFTRIGAQDEIHAGQSTFMVEMIETANILHNATNRSLLILDEIGRGTSTYDGVAIAWAVVEYIHNHPHLRSRTLFATHYHELTDLANRLPGVRNYNVAVSEEGGQVVFLHKIMPGGADKSYGIHVAELAGLPRPVVHRAGEILAQFEASASRPGPASVPSKQLRLFPESNPLLDELKALDVNSMSPLEALNNLFSWQERFLRDEQDEETGSEPQT